MFVEINPISMGNHFATLQKLIKDNENTAGCTFNLDDIGATLDNDFHGYCKHFELIQLRIQWT